MANRPKRQLGPKPDLKKLQARLKTINVKRSAPKMRAMPALHQLLPAGKGRQAVTTNRVQRFRELVQRLNLK
jgi:hypothetical protein